MLHRHSTPLECQSVRHADTAKYVSDTPCGVPENVDFSDTLLLPAFSSPIRFRDEEDAHRPPPILRRTKSPVASPAVRHPSNLFSLHRSDLFSLPSIVAAVASLPVTSLPLAIAAVSSPPLLRMEEFAYFSLNMGDYSSAEALKNKFHFEPLIWWVSYGPSTPYLQSLAFKLLNQPCSSSCCERNWSTYNFIQSLKRNKLQPKRAQDLVYVHKNLRLLARKDFNYHKDKDSMWDIGGDGHESMEPANIDVLELATLSLDEPALERILVDDEMES
ncbi:hypothetical protein ACLB2K_058865 [Fragaria x ananassa]